jgi:manganese/zinc/iron transport system substrate-binding protein
MIIKFSSLNLTFSTILFLTVLSGCVWHPQKIGNPKLIVCTTTIIGDAVKKLVKERYSVKVLMGAGIDPHMYEAKPSDIRALGNSRVIIYNGLHLEGKMTSLFERMRDEKEIIAFSDGMKRNSLIKVNSHTIDPHVWFNPLLWLQGVKHCVNQLIKVFPKDKDFILSNYKSLEKEYYNLNEDLKNKIHLISKPQRILITSHDAFHYFGKAFDVEVLAVQGVSTVSEPGLKDVSNLVNLIVKRKVKAIFVESSVSSKSITAVIEGCKTNGQILKIGGTLYSDALGDKKSGANTYLGMMKINVNTLVEALKENNKLKSKLIK